MPIGERIRVYRRRRGLSQPVLAQLVGRSESWLSQVERGLRTVDKLSVITELARVLRVSPADLIGHMPDRTSKPARFAALGRIRSALLEYKAIPALLDPAAPPHPPSDAAARRRQIDEVNRLYQAGRYSATGQQLPHLIASAHISVTAATGNERRIAERLLAETYHITAKTLTKIGETELAWIVAERALTLAERAEEPLLVAASAYHLGLAFLRAGNLADAKRVSLMTASSLGLAASASPERVSTSGALYLTAAIAAAREQDRREAERLLFQAAMAAERLGTDGNALWTAFGPTNVRIHQGSVASEVGDAAEVVRIGEQLDVTCLPQGLKGRRTQVLIDLARGYGLRRLDAAAVNVLLEAERTAPEAVWFHESAQALVRDLLRREHAASTPQLRGLAQRVGVLD